MIPVGMAVAVVIWGGPILAPLGAITGTISVQTATALASSAAWFLLPVQLPSNSDITITPVEPRPRRHQTLHETQIPDCFANGCRALVPRDLPSNSDITITPVEPRPR